MYADMCFAYNASSSNQQYKNTKPLLQRRSFKISIERLLGSLIKTDVSLVLRNNTSKWYKTKKN